MKKGIGHGLFQFIVLGTPADEDGSADLRYVLSVAKSLAEHIEAFDPEALDEARRIYGDSVGLTLCQTPEEAIEGAEALCIVTEWKNFWSPDFMLLKAKLADSVIFDGRNLYDPKLLKQMGIQYYGIGRLY